MLQLGRQGTICDPTGLRLTQMLNISTVPEPAALSRSETKDSQDDRPLLEIMWI